MDLVLLVITIDEILDDGVRLPQSEVVIIVVDESRDACELISFMLSFSSSQPSSRPLGLCLVNSGSFCSFLPKSRNLVSYFRPSASRTITTFYECVRSFE
jgi:hypothetical protein